MITNNQVKTIRSLATRKGRKATGWFMAEGPKVVGDLQAAGFKPVALFDSNDDVRRISQLQHPQGIVGIFEIPATEEGNVGIDPKQLTLVLDGVQDPGNLGTIIRVADWFGIQDIWCSPETADCWNPKVLQATMGSIAHVRIHYAPLVPIITRLPKECPIYVTQLDGDNIYEASLTSNGVIVMGNEGNGVTKEIRRLATYHLLIPSYPQGRTTAESLNVAIATAIVLGEFRRKIL